MIDDLNALVVDPRKLSAKEIAVELSARHLVTVTRNSVISRCSRLGLMLPLALTPMEKHAGKRVGQRTKAHRAAKPPKRKRTGFSMPAPTPKWECGNPGVRIARAAEFRRQAKGEAMQTELPPVGQRKSIMELTSAHCRYIFGDVREGNYFFCGDQALPGLSWCAKHDQLCRPGAYVVTEPFLQAAE